ncbi:hypothetical protein [Microvirga calopogonii]|uniref:hypothetical protein n=1 Tax=Microvirga calopogonii TaxID=2078013 RepID=UPI0013B3BF17|nr:hypothetical protein [Microvirga calopogonii]
MHIIKVVQVSAELEIPNYADEDISDPREVLTLYERHRGFAWILLGLASSNPFEKYGVDHLFEGRAHLTRLIHGDPSEVGFASLTGSFDGLSGMSSPPPRIRLGG